MRRAAFWTIFTVLISASFGAEKALAEGSLVLVNEDGEEVLHLDAENPSTGLQALEMGRYLLKVDEPGEYSVLIGNSTILQIDRVEDDDDDSEGGDSEDWESHDLDDSPVVLDANLDPGDQGEREALAGETGDRIDFQLTGIDLPEIYGWSVTLEYDPEQVAFVAGSFTPSTFIPNIVIPGEDDRGGKLVIGGANFTKDLSSGDGDLGSFGFEILAGFNGRAELRITAFTALTLDAIDEMQVESVAAIVNEFGQDSGDDGEDDEDVEEDEDDALDLSGEEAISHLLEENECPGCDLRGAGLMKEELQEADLSGADLSGANLFRTDLSHADLEGSILVSANMLQTELRQANLRNADLSNAKLLGAKLQEADLTGANLDGATLFGASLTGAIWTDGSECGTGSVGTCK